MLPVLPSSSLCATRSLLRVRVHGGESMLAALTARRPVHSLPHPPQRSPDASSPALFQSKVVDHVSGTLQAPLFRVPPSHIHILHEPHEFYQALKSGIQSAQSRVTLASLYLGTGPEEHDLMQALAAKLSAAAAAARPFQANILLDCLRGSRGENIGKSSRSMLVPLLQSHSRLLSASLYHTPLLRGWKKRLIPAKFDETVSVQHMKVYIFDDSLLLSGANMSDSYFTNRQDRYVLFRNCPDLADYFHDVVACVQSHSYRLTPANTLEANGLDPLTCDLSDFRASISAAIQSVQQAHRKRSAHLQSASLAPSDKAVVFPLLQMGCFDVRQDESATAFLFSTASAADTAWIASGYFNLPEKYQSLVLASKSNYNILTAAPQANGFFGAKGVPGLVPNAYTHIEREFFRAAEKAGRSHAIRLYEYFRDGWTFHGKGLWVYPSGESLPSFCLIGSPNFGFRSVYRDLEAQVGIFLPDPKGDASLARQFHLERERLFERGARVTWQTFENASRHVSPGVAFTTRRIKSFF